MKEDIVKMFCVKIVDLCRYASSASWLQENRWICENDSPYHVFFGKIILPTNIRSTALEQMFKLGFGTRNFVPKSLPFHATVVSFVRGFGGGGSLGITN